MALTSQRKTLAGARRLSFETPPLRLVSPGCDCPSVTQSYTTPSLAVTAAIHHGARAHAAPCMHVAMQKTHHTTGRRNGTASEEPRKAASLS